MPESLSESSAGPSLTDRLKAIEKRLAVLEAAGNQTGPIINVPEQSSDPAAPGADKAKVYAKNSGGRSKLYIEDDTGVAEVGSQTKHDHAADTDADGGYLTNDLHDGYMQVNPSTEPGAPTVDTNKFKIWGMERLDWPDHPGCFMKDDDDRNWPLHPPPNRFWHRYSQPHAWDFEFDVDTLPTNWSLSTSGGDVDNDLSGSWPGMGHIMLLDSNCWAYYQRTNLSYDSQPFTLNALVYAPILYDGQKARIVVGDSTYNNGMVCEVQKNSSSQYRCDLISIDSGSWTARYGDGPYSHIPSPWITLTLDYFYSTNLWKAGMGFDGYEGFQAGTSGYTKSFTIDRFRIEFCHESGPSRRNHFGVVWVRRDSHNIWEIL